MKYYCFHLVSRPADKREDLRGDLLIESCDLETAITVDTFNHYPSSLHQLLDYDLIKQLARYKNNENNQESLYHIQEITL